MIDSHNWTTYNNPGPGRGAGGGGRARAGYETMHRTHQHTRHHWGGGRRRDQTAWLRCRWAVAGPGRTTSRRAEPEARGADGSRAGRRPRAHRAARPSRHRTQQQPGYAKGAGTEVPAPCRLTQPLPRRGSGRMILSPGDGDASTGTCRPRRPLPGPLRRSGRRSRCGRGPSSAWWPGRRARRNRSSRR